MCSIPIQLYEFSTVASRTLNDNFLAFASGFLRRVLQENFSTNNVLQHIGGRVQHGLRLGHDTAQKTPIYSAGGRWAGLRRGGKRGGQVGNRQAAARAKIIESWNQRVMNYWFWIESSFRYEFEYLLLYFVALVYWIRVSERLSSYRETWESEYLY